MKKTFLFLVLITSLLNVNSYSQTTLAQGDIAFIGLNASLGDQFSFLLLKDITNGTSIEFTDKGWKDLDGFHTQSGEDEWITWTATDNYSAGTVVNIQTSVYSQGSWTANASIGSISGSISFFSFGDQVFAYQGSEDNPTIIAGLHYNIETSTSNSNWDSDGIITLDASQLPDQLTNGVNAIWVYAPGHEQGHNFRYNCAVTTGSPSQLRTAINNVANWEVDETNDTPYTLDPFPCSFTIAEGVCVDPTIPTVTASSSTICPSGSSALTITGTLSDATAWQVYTGSCDGTNIGSTATSTFTVSPTTTTTYYIRGEGGCVTPGSCSSVTVTVEDVTPPTAVCQDITVYLDGTGNASIIAADVDGGSTDNCATPALSVDVTTFDCSDLGDNTVTLTATDASGNVDANTATVTVLDTEDPIPDVELEVIFASCSVDTVYPPTATDNCAGTIEGTTTTVFPVTTTKVLTWWFNDGNGNITSQTQTVYISNSDDIAPVADIATLSDITDECSIDAIIPPTATGNCGGVINATTTTLFPITTQGTTVVTWTFDDGNDNIITQNQNVILVDVTDPTIICANDTVINLEDGQTVYTVEGEELNPIENNDNCGVVTHSNDFNNGLSLSGEEFEIGTTTVNWVVEDIAGNTTTGTINVTVNQFTGIKSISDESLNIYPNPTTGIVNISSNDLEKYNLIIVRDAIGKIITQKQIFNNTVQLDLSNNESGLYIIELKGDINPTFNKVIVE